MCSSQTPLYLCRLRTNERRRFSDKSICLSSARHPPDQLLALKYLAIVTYKTPKVITFTMLRVNVTQDFNDSQGHLERSRGK